jgi:hypothetical protein
LSFHFCNPGAGFSKDADCVASVPIYFGREFFSSFDRRLELEQFINLSGDFNGDGRKDLLVRDRRDSLKGYCLSSRQKGFRPRPDLRFNCPETIDWWDVKDLNGDGVSDVVAKLRKPGTFRIFLSRRQ